MAKRSAGSATTEKLNELGQWLVEAEYQKKGWETEVAVVKAEISELVERYSLPIHESKSEYFNLPEGGALRVTRTTAPVPKLLTAALLAGIRCRLVDEAEANRVFLDVAVLSKNCEVDVDVWRRYVEDETLVNQLLLDALEPERPAPKPSVQLTSTKRVDA